MMMKILSFLLFVSIFLTIGCKETVEPAADCSFKIPEKGVFVLNEGLFNQNNTSLSFFNTTTEKVTSGLFECQNNFKLGGSGSDINIYGSKLYIVMSESGNVTVVNSKTGKFIKQIPFVDENKASLQPRRIAFYDGYAFVTSYDDRVSVIDTATLTVEEMISVGQDPEGIALQNGKLYVANSGGLNFPNYDNTVSVIDPDTRTVIKTIEVTVNPVEIVPDDYGDLYVVSRGNYDNIPPKLQVINSMNDQLKPVDYNFAVQNIAVNGNKGYVINFDFNMNISGNVIELDIENDLVKNPNFILGNNFETVYTVAVDPAGGDIYFTDTKGFVNTGEVKYFNSSGDYIDSFSSEGLNPGRMTFIE